MIVQLFDLPAGVLGFSAHGQVTANDYETVLIPDIEAAFALNRKLRVLFHVANDFTGFDAGAMWDDLKLGFRHITGWDRVAVVSDVSWIRTMCKMFGFEMPEARIWIAQTN